MKMPLSKPSIKHNLNQKSTKRTDGLKLQLLCDHYKDTFSQLREYIKQRDRLFIIILILITVMLFQTYSPKQSGEMMSQIVAQKLGLANPFDMPFLLSIIWFSLFAAVVRYFQTVVQIERQYDYIHNMEEEISSNYGNKIFTREGKSYLEKYLLFSEWASIIYTIIFPLLLIVVLVIKIYNEIPDVKNISLLPGVNLIIFFCIFASTVLYLLSVHFHR